MEEHFGFHRNEIATYIKQLQDLQKYFEEP